MGGIIQLASPAEVDQLEADEQQLDADAAALQEQEAAMDQLAGYIRRRWYEFKRHRTTENLEGRYLESLRAYNGEYDNTTKRAISEFGGSEVYSRVSAIKCRGATSLLRDIFLGAEKTWGLSPTPVPVLPEDIGGNVDQLVMMEALAASNGGVPVDPQKMEDRRKQLMEAAEKAAVKQAHKEAAEAENYLEDILVEGQFDEALRDFLTDLPIFQFACIKGPVVRNVHRIKWVGGEMQRSVEPKPFWNRVSPFDVYFDPGAEKLEDSAVIEKIKMTRADLNAMIGVDGYDDDAIRSVLNDFATGQVDWLDEVDTERAELEDKENPHQNYSELIDALEWNGPVKGSALLDYGFTAEQIPDGDLDYYVTAWLINRYVIKAHINPNPNHRAPYYATSFEKVPGSLYGHGIPEIISDAQQVANATLRAMVNNLAISSGPQVGLREDQLSPNQDSDSMYPWKRWRFISDPMAGGNNTPPISFFQPDSHAQELLGVYQSMMNIADETSGIPRYLTGGESKGGAADTASGLSMMINNASKVLQNVAYNIDTDVLKPSLTGLYDFVMLTDDEKKLRGDESIVVRGVELALKKDTDRMRQLEYLQLTANEMDMSIVGQDGRAAILRTLADNLGLTGRRDCPVKRRP